MTAPDMFAADLAELNTLATTILDALAYMEGADRGEIVDRLLLHEATDQWHAEKGRAAV